MIRLKEGVSIVGLQPQMTLGLFIVAQVYNKYGVECVITSGVEGEHMVGSKHPEGLALDFRKRDFANDTVVEAVVADIQRALNGRASNSVGEFDVTISKYNIHMEFDPK